MLIYNINFCFVQVSKRFFGLPLIFLLGAPQTGKISLAKQQATRVQLHCPDFDNGMKTQTAPIMAQFDKLHCPDFDNGMKTTLSAMLYS